MPDPAAIMQLGSAFWASKTLLSAVELGLFTELAANGPGDAEDLRERLGHRWRIVDCADKIMLTTIGTYYAPNRTLPELHEQLKNGTGLVDPLKDFAEAVREEMQSFASV